MPTLTDRSPRRGRRLAGLAAVLLLGLATSLSGCGREPTPREVQNARAFEALLTAVSLKDEKEVESDARLIDERHASGELSDARYREIAEILEKARAKDWPGAVSRAYEFRSQFGDRGAFFK